MSGHSRAADDTDPGCALRQGHRRRGPNVDDVQEATGEDPVAGEWKATGCAAAAATAMGTTAVPKAASLIDPQRDRVLRMQHAETMRKADEHAGCSAWAVRSTIDRRGCRWHAVDRPSMVTAMKAETIRMLASPSPEGPRQRGRGG